MSVPFKIGVINAGYCWCDEDGIRFVYSFENGYIIFCYGHNG